EREKRFMGRTVETLTVEMKLNVCSCGSMTIRRPDLAKGFEPDECYYIQNEPLVRGTRELDFTVDPPPDLGLEVDVTSSSIDREALYAAIGVPELWRFDGVKLEFLVLQANRVYARVERSRCFPFLTPHILMTYLSQIDQRPENELLMEFV